MNSTARWFLSGLLLLLTVVIHATGNHLSLDIQCGDYFPGPPDCCTVVSDSAGSSVQYSWSVMWGYGYVDPTPTMTNSSHFYCNPYQNHTEQIFNVADGLLGHGYGNCFWYG